MTGQSIEKAGRHCWLRLRLHKWRYSHAEGSNGVLYQTSVYACAKCAAKKYVDPGPVEVR